MFAVLALGVGCGGSEPHEAEAPAASASTEVTSKAPHHVPFTKPLIDQNQLTPDDVARLQFYIRGRIVLRREATASGRVVTDHHTLKRVDGQAFDEVLVANGTPGIYVSSDGEDKLRINFDNEKPDATLEFEVMPDDRYRLRPDEPVAHDSKIKLVTYMDEPYRLMEGSSAYLEITEEDLRAVAKRQRKLPGALLPIDSSAPADSAPPVESMLPPVVPPAPAQSAPSAPAASSAP
jgi:hypothetical protein